MTMPAVVMALEAMSQPDIVKRQLRRPLPRDLIDLIKCAAGDVGTITRITTERNIREDSLVEASKFFLRHVVGSGGNDNYRTLGLPRSASTSEVREHRKWLLKWLHPDRNPSKWEAQMFHSVETAANRLLDGVQGSAASATRQTRSRPGGRYKLAPLGADMDLEETDGEDALLLRKRKFLMLVCLGLSMTTLVLFGIFEWYIAA
jgi:DnaJ domain